ncbi:MAG: hypothetical protein HWD58_16680 [Bacteroidota bacterium]|nr:MAG: hypothetical protein HWD58_16680 [Bacteroidota bacterium]
MKRILSFLIVLTSLVIAGNRLNAQANNYSCVLKNIHLASATELEFDIWLQWTGTNTAYLASLEAGINFNYAGLPMVERSQDLSCQGLRIQVCRLFSKL